MQEYRKGRDIYLMFKDDAGNALANAYEYDIDSDVVSIVQAARIVRKGTCMFQAHQSFSGSFPDNCQQDSVPQLLLTMILEGPSIEELSSKSSASVCMQFLSF